MNGRVLATLLLSAAAHGQRVTAPSEVVFGAPFEVVVEVSAAGDGAFDASGLLPLEVELRERRTVGAGERLVFSARCYEVGEVTLAVPGAPTLQVRTSLPEPPGAMEWPSTGWERVDAARGHGLWYGLLGVLAVTLFGWWRWAARRALPSSVSVEHVVAAYDAAAALQALPLPTAGDAEPFYRELKAIVRRHCADRFAVRAEVRTSEELLRAVPAGGDGLRSCLSACDLVLFGRGLGHDGAHDAVRARAVAFVRATEAAS